MSSINGLGNVPNVNPVQRPGAASVAKQVPADPPNQIPVSDRVELSGISSYMDTLKANPIRADKVAQVRAQIQAGKYETDQKINAAVAGLLDDLK